MISKTTFKLLIENIEQAVFLIAKETLDRDQPIPEFESNYPNILESRLEQPCQTFGGNGLYPNLIDKAAILFYLLFKNHPFQNGNKKIAITALYIFLDLNNTVINTNPMKL